MLLFIGAVVIIGAGGVAATVIVLAIVGVEVGAAVDDVGGAAVDAVVVTFLVLTLLPVVYNSTRRLSSSARLT